MRFVNFGKDFLNRIAVRQLLPNYEKIDMQFLSDTECGTEQRDLGRRR
jgi:hypothetical protein